MAQVSSEQGVAGSLRWAAVNRAMDGESVSGDLHVVLAADQSVLMAVIDGLGHGDPAAAAAEQAALALSRDPAKAPHELLAACDAALNRSRGAVISIVRVEGERLRWAGVGNVEGILIRRIQREPRPLRLPLANGIVGQCLPKISTAEALLSPGDLVVLGTDGLRADFADHVRSALSPERIVHHVMLHCRTGRDDALVLAARYDGAA